MAGLPRAAGLVSRSVALAVDVGLITVLCLAASGLPGLVAEQLTGDTPGWLNAIAATVASLLPWLYFTVCWWLSGQTAGDLLVGITVLRRDGESVGLLRAALRSAVGLLLFPVWLVGLIGIVLDDQRRAWHDRVFGTEVVYTHSG